MLNEIYDTKLKTSKNKKATIFALNVISYVQTLISKNKNESLKNINKALVDIINKDNMNIWTSNIKKNIDLEHKKEIDNLTKNELIQFLEIASEMLNKLTETERLTIDDNKLEILFKDVLLAKRKKEEVNNFDKNKIKTISIEIKNIKNIVDLKFEINLDNNLIAIIGENGCGKSTLLTCMSKIVDRDSIKKEFKGTDLEFSNSSISYTFIDNNKNKEEFVWIRKKGWICDIGQASNMPKLNGIFESNVFFGERFTKPFFKKDSNDYKVISEEKNKIKNSELVVKALGEILYSDKNIFSEIVKIDKIISINNQKEEYTEYFIYKKIDNKPISQIDWSSGEYLLFKVLEYIIDIENSKQDKSQARLIIIDEIELSLHPLAQKRMIKYLDKLSRINNILIIITTHSPYIIKEIDKNNIFSMKKIDNENIIDKPPIFIGNLISELTNNEYFDSLILVEDEIAKLFIQIILSENLDIFPKYNIIPLGGWNKVLDIVEVHKNSALFNTDKILTVLDGDVEDIIKRDLDKLKELLKKSDEEINNEIKVLKTTLNEIEEDDDEEIKKIKSNIKTLENSKKDSTKIKELEQHLVILKEKNKISNNNVKFLPIYNVENYVNDILLNCELFKKIIHRDYNVIVNNKLKSKDKKAFGNLTNLIISKNKYFTKMTLIQIIIKRLEKEKDKKYLEFKNALLRFF